MSDLDALLAGIVANPHEYVRWLIVADWLDDHDQPDRAELLRLHRMMIDTCCEPDAHPERAAWHGRVMELLRSGAEPCVPRRTLSLPGGVALPMVFVPPGSFRMGSPDAEAGRSGDEAAHAVTLTKGLFVAVSPVTQAQWRAVAGDEWSSRVRGDDLPMEDVSWDRATAFCERLSDLLGVAGRLPSEAEWEYAARAGTTTPFYWGGELNGTEANCDGNYPYGTEATGPYLRQTTPVGRYAAVSPHPWGLVDLHGNVWEWCADWYDEGFYGRSPAEDPICKDGEQTHRLLRGGSWYSDPLLCRAACRFPIRPGYFHPEYGFRVVFSTT